jgi:hypothetical protein
MLKNTVNKISPYLKNSIGVLLFLVCSIAIYKKVLINQDWKNIKDIFKGQLVSISFLDWVILFLFMFANLFVESIKWNVVIKHNNPQSIYKSLQSVFIGQAFAFFTPNRIGEYAGRTMFLNAGNKLIGIAQMAWTSYAQLLITIVFGTTALFFNLSAYAGSNISWLFWVQLLSPLVGLLATFFFFYNNTWQGWLSPLNVLQIKNSVKFQLLGWSLIKYTCFLVQYILLAKLLKMDIPISTLSMSLSIMFLCLSILPTISATEWVVRGQVLIMILTPFYSNNITVVSLSSIIWGINFLIPAIIGTMLLLGYRVKN